MTDLVDTAGGCKNRHDKQSAETPCYDPDLGKDISFLKEMKGILDRAVNGNGWDRMKLDYLSTMINDWLEELESVERS